MFFLPKLVVIGSLALLVNGCAWIKPLPQSHSIALLQAKDVVNCVKKGMTQSKTLSKIIFVPRLDSKIQTELVTLAKNEAAIMGGDAVVAESELKSGGQTFGVYLCRND